MGQGHEQITKYIEFLTTHRFKEMKNMTRANALF